MVSYTLASVRGSLYLGYLHFSSMNFHQKILLLLFITVPEQPTNLQGEPTSPNTIQLTWDAPETSPDDVIESYELYYNDSHFRQNVRVTISPPRNTYLLEDLTPDTVYHIRVAARSARGEGASTPTVQVRTIEFGELQTNKRCN